MKNKNLISQILKFGVIGGIAFVIDYLTLIICKELLNLNLFISTALAFTVSVIFNYIASIKWVFNVDENSNSKKNFTVFIILSIVGLILTEIIMDIGVHDFNISYLIVKIVATGIVMVFNFITRKIFLENAYKDGIKKAYYSKTSIIIFAFISYLTLCFNGIVKKYDIMSLFILIFLIIIFLKYFIPNKNFKKSIPIFSIIFSILLVFGNLCFYNMYSKDVNILSEMLSKNSLISIIGYYMIIKVFLNWLFPRIYKLELISKPKKPWSKKRVFIVTFIILLLAWTPYLLSMYPGLISVDSLRELTNASKGVLNLDNHTIAHLLVIRLSYLIGYGLTGKMMGAVLAYSIIQMTTMSLVFSYLVTFLYNKNVNKKVLIGIILFYALVPIFGYLSIVMWKDIFFGTFCLWLSIECYRMIEDKDLKISTLIRFLIASLLTIFFRNNAIYMYIILIIFSFIFFPKTAYKKISIVFVIVLGVFFTVKGPIFNYFNVQKSGSAEYLAIPIQQIGRMVYKDDNLTKSDKEKIDKLLNTKTIKKVYNPTCVDAIKFNKDFNIKPFKENKLTYLNLWLQLVIKHPDTAIESYAISTLGYWYPNIKDRAYEVVSVENNIGVKTESRAPAFIQNTIMKLGDYELPVVCFFWSIGLLIWIVWILIYICYKKGRVKNIYTFVPVLGVWLTLLVATPVYNETRYIFSLFTTLPLFAVIPYLNIKNN